MAKKLTHSQKSFSIGYCKGREDTLKLIKEYLKSNLYDKPDDLGFRKAVSKHGLTVNEFIQEVLMFVEDNSTEPEIPNETVQTSSWDTTPRNSECFSPVCNTGYI